jgi:hypothetical protein
MIFSPTCAGCWRHYAPSLSWSMAAAARTAASSTPASALVSKAPACLEPALLADLGLEGAEVLRALLANLGLEGAKGAKGLGVLRAGVEAHVLVFESKLRTPAVASRRAEMPRLSSCDRVGRLVLKGAGAEGRLAPLAIVAAHVRCSSSARSARLRSRASAQSRLDLHAATGSASKKLLSLLLLSSVSSCESGSAMMGRLHGLQA